MAIIYDQETSGLDHFFGQIFQLGTTVTDDDFNIVKEYNLRSRRQPWVIPSPSAMLITKIDPSMIEEGESAFEMMRQFNDIIRAEPSPLRTYGYNIMHFDDPGLRIAFDQNLLQSRLTSHKEEGAERNARIDILVMLQALNVHNSSAINLETKNRNGSPAMRLGVVCRQNGIDLSEDAAHEALADNHGTIGVAKLIKDRAIGLWDHMMGMTTQEGADAFLSNETVLSHTEYNFGKSKTRTVAPLGHNAGNAAEAVAFDLSFDPEKFASLSVEDLAKKMAQKRANPFVFVKTDSMPILLPVSMVEDASRPNIDDADLNARASALVGNEELRTKIAQAAAIRAQAAEPSKYVEHHLTQEVSDAGLEKLREWRKSFYHADWQGRAELVDGFDGHFESVIEQDPMLERFKRFGKRIMFDNAPELLSGDEISHLQKAFASRVLHDRGPEEIVTIPRALKELGEIREKFEAGTLGYVAADEGSRITDLENYYKELGAKYEAMAVG